MQLRAAKGAVFEPEADVATSESAMAVPVNLCGVLGGVLDGTSWEMFDAISKLGDERASAAKSIRDSVVEALRCDEHVRPLGATLREAQSKSVRLLAEVTAPAPVRPAGVATAPTDAQQPVIPPASATPGRRVVDEGSRAFDEVGSARDQLDSIANQLTSGRSLVVTISWRIEEESTKP